uniref:Lipase_GDSL domain-containing protein n=1 Tax=Globodera pallida TaxID=36090 RepID=A0A183C6W6_GLOPA
MRDGTLLIKELKKHAKDNSSATEANIGNNKNHLISPHEDEESDSSSEEEEDQGDSDVSEERNPEDLINSELSAVKLPDSEQQRPDDVVSIINSAFSNRKSFSCPKIKTDLRTGTSTADLSPEDIGIIASMGDSLATGAGLWPRTDIEFRGAAFPIGGDATIDGLVTVPNILREFIDSNMLHGVSHGMGQRDQLPDNQLNVAVSGASSSSMPKQASELVRRMKRLRELDVFNTWALVIVTIGTEEVCKNCTGPNTKALIEALDVLNRGIHKALVILLGPIHVTSLYEQKFNLLKTRCLCSQSKDDRFMSALTYIIRSYTNPYSLFIPNKPLLNRRGHTYAAKWLWNRLVAGPKYNLSNAVLSQDAYFCPSLGCPYFRTADNFNRCGIRTHEEARLIEQKLEERRGRNKFGPQLSDLYFATSAIVAVAGICVLCLGTIFYQRSKKGSKGRFDVVLPHGPPAHYRKITKIGTAPPTEDRTRCLCSQSKDDRFMSALSEQWIKAFEHVQTHMENAKRKTFNALALPMLTVTSRYPYSLFIPNKPLLNRRGHTYAAKWLWNRLVAGPKYNLSNAVLSQDAYFCPSLGCPYFRTADNFNRCGIRTHEEARLIEQKLEERRGRNKFGPQLSDLYFATSAIVAIAGICVLCLGTIFYQRSKKGSKGRFDVVLPHGPPAHYRKITKIGTAPPTEDHLMTLIDHGVHNAALRDH